MPKKGEFIQPLNDPDWIMRKKMKMKSLLITGGLSLALGACAFAGISANKNNVQSVNAYSTAGLTLVTRSNLSTYEGHDVVILSHSDGTPDYQLAWNGSALSLASSGSPVVYTIRDVDSENSQFTIYYGDTNHYLGEDGGTGFNKTTPLNYGLTDSNAFGRPAYTVYGPDDPVTGDPSATFFPEMYIGWTKPAAGNASYYYGNSKPMIIGGTRGDFYLYAITDEDLLAANQFAQTFLTTTGGICKDTSIDPTDTDTSDLADVWNAKKSGDGTSLVEKWGELSPEAKAKFAAGTATATIADANARYVHIMGRYSAILTPFTDGPTLTAGNVQTLSTNNANNSTMVVVGIGSLALVSVGAFIIIPKRKQN